MCVQIFSPYFTPSGLECVFPVGSFFFKKIFLTNTGKETEFLLLSDPKRI